MSKTMTSTVPVTLLTASLLALSTLVGCDRATSPNRGQPAAPNGQASNTAGQTSASPLSDTLLLATAPADARPIADLKREIQPGDTVTIAGYVGGSEQPFVDGRAVMTVVDRTVPNRCLGDDDHCQTPWDYCCDITDAREGMATVRVTSQDGAIIRASLKGFGGLTELSEVTITGKVAAVAPQNLLLDIVGLHVAQGPSKKK